MNKVILIILTFLFISCNNTSKSNQNLSKDKNDKNVYDIDELPEELKEISGITFINDSLIAAVEDEHGTIYYYDLTEKKIVELFVFAENGDYEDLVVVENNLYVVESNGTIYEILNYRDGDRKTNIYKTPLKSKNDIEGLTYDEQRNSLLLSVKEKNLDDKAEHEKNIYSFSLTNKTFNTTPVYHIRFADIESRYEGDKLIEISKKFLKAVGNRNLNEVMKPSAMAFHPITKDLYVLSSINKIVVVLSPNDTLKKIIPVKGEAFRQPEGLSFNSKGEMYISNEGNQKKSNLIKVTLSDEK